MTREPVAMPEQPSEAAGGLSAWQEAAAKVFVASLVLAGDV